MLDLRRLRVLESARKHGLQDDDVLRAIRSALKWIYGYPREGTVTVVGFDAEGLPIEVMIDVALRHAPTVFHARRIDERRQRDLLGLNR